MVETIIRSDYARWDELDEDDRSVIRERIANGELPHPFRVTRHRYYIGRRPRDQYLEPEPLRNGSIAKRRARSCERSSRPHSTRAESAS